MSINNEKKLQSYHLRHNGQTIAMFLAYSYDDAVSQAINSIGPDNCPNGNLPEGYRVLSPIVTCQGE